MTQRRRLARRLAGRGAGRVRSAPRTLPAVSSRPEPRDEKETPLRGREDPPDAGRQEEAADVPRRGGRRPLAARRALHRDHRAVRPRQDPSFCQIDAESALAWLRKGAQPTEQVQKLLTEQGVWAQYEAERGKPADTKLSRRGYATGKVKPPEKQVKEAKAPAGRGLAGTGRSRRLTTRPRPTPSPPRTPPTTTRRRRTAADTRDRRRASPSERRVDDYGDRRLRGRDRRRGQPHQRRPRAGRHRVRHPQPGRRSRRDRGRRRGATATRSR